MNPVLTKLMPTERPETPCTGCTHSTWYIGTPQTEKMALAAFCGVLGRQVYNSQGDGKTVQTCGSFFSDEGGAE